MQARKKYFAPASPYDCFCMQGNGVKYYIILCHVQHKGKKGTFFSMGLFSLVTMGWVSCTVTDHPKH
jgi:hypothetical protein